MKKSQQIEKLERYIAHLYKLNRYNEKLKVALASNPSIVKKIKKMQSNNNENAGHLMQIVSKLTTINETPLLYTDL